MLGSLLPMSTVANRNKLTDGIKASRTKMGKRVPPIPSHDEPTPEGQNHSTAQPAGSSAQGILEGAAYPAMRDR
ncbi:MAG: hypothetical protein Q6L68_07475 [Thermostichus sp. DG02_5_bins_236]